MTRKLIHSAVLIGLIFTVLACDGLNIFSVGDDRALGASVDAEIQADPTNYPILPEQDYPEAYAYLRGIRDEILDSGEVGLREDFDWDVHIIADDNVLNAFATPGGYLYFYTGLIKYLDSEDDFAGVMGHEIAHADQRHSTDAMTREFGLSILLDIVLGANTNFAVQIAEGLAGLAFSRSAESEADEFSVIYLSKTEYRCDGAAGFFEKLVAGNMDSGGPEFLSTHPNPDNRVEAIQAKASGLNCSTTPSDNDYAAFKALLP